MFLRINKRFFSPFKKPRRKKNVNKTIRFFRSPFYWNINWSLPRTPGHDTSFVIQIIFSLNRFPETKPAYQSEHTETFVGMFVGVVLTGIYSDTLLKFLLFLPGFFSKNLLLSSQVSSRTLKLKLFILFFELSNVPRNIRIWPAQFSLSWAP